MTVEGPTFRKSTFPTSIKKILRDPTECIHHGSHPNTMDEVIHHSIKGGIRAFVLAYGANSTVQFCISMAKVLTGKTSFSHTLRVTLKNQDSLRFGAMLGSFGFLWKSINNGMRIYRGKDDRWNGLVSGSVAGLSILFEKKERRIGIAQQLFVRALQAIYNAGKARNLFYFKHGDALLFSICTSHIFYAYMMRPDSLPPAIYRFMLRAGQVPKEALMLNAKAVRGNLITTDEALNVINCFQPTKHAINTVGNMSYKISAVPCEVFHPSVDGCTLAALTQFKNVFKNHLPMYTILHFAPMLIFRANQFKKSPASMLSKTVITTLKSGTFFSTLVTLFQLSVCTQHATLKKGIVANSKYFYFFCGLVAALPSIFIEAKKRRSELALYTLSNAMNSIYQIAYSHHWILKLKYFEVLMTSASMGILMSFYQHEANVLSSFVNRIMYQFFQIN